jgi:hypothetical protein
MREESAGGGKGPLISSDKSLTLATGNNQVLINNAGFGKYTENEIASTLKARDYKDAADVVVREI